MARNNRVILRLLAGSLATVLLLPGCQKQAAAPPKPPPPLVTVAAPVKKPLEVFEEYVGQLDSPRTVELRSRVEGFVKEINFQDGAEVQEGALLFVIDPAPYELALQKAEAELQVSEAELAQANDVKQIEVDRAEVARTEAILTNARKLAENNQVAFTKGAVAREQVDNLLTAAKEAEAAVASAQAKLAQAEKDYHTGVAQATARAAVNRAAVADAKLSLSYTRVYAPLTGRIDRAEVKVGSLVRNNGESTLLATVSQISPVWAYFSVAETEGFELQKRQQNENGHQPKVQMVLEDGSLYEHGGQLNYMSRAVDAATGTLMLRAEFLNPGKFLRPGNYAKIRLMLAEHPNAVLVSERALGVDQAGKFVLVVNEKNVVERRSIKVGVRTGGMIEIQEGLAGTERVVVNGLQRARPGSEVNPAEEKPAADGAKKPGDPVAATPKG